MIRVLIADDHPIVRQGLRQILAGTADMEVAGEAVNPIVATPAAPIAILIAPVVPVVTPPETAVMVAVPD